MLNIFNKRKNEKTEKQKAEEERKKKQKFMSEKYYFIQILAATVLGIVLATNFNYSLYKLAAIIILFLVFSTFSIMLFKESYSEESKKKNRDKYTVKDLDIHRLIREEYKKEYFAERRRILNKENDKNKNKNEGI